MSELNERDYAQITAAVSSISQSLKDLVIQAVETKCVVKGISEDMKRLEVRAECDDIEKQLREKLECIGKSNTEILAKIGEMQGKEDEKQVRNVVMAEFGMVGGAGLGATITGAALQWSGNVDAGMLISAIGVGIVVMGAVWAYLQVRRRKVVLIKPTSRQQ